MDQEKISQYFEVELNWKHLKSKFQNFFTKKPYIISIYFIYSIIFDWFSQDFWL